MHIPLIIVWVASIVTHVIFGIKKASGAPSGRETNMYVAVAVSLNHQERGCILLVVGDLPHHHISIFAPTIRIPSTVTSPSSNAVRFSYNTTIISSIYTIIRCCTTHLRINWHCLSGLLQDTIT